MNIVSFFGVVDFVPFHPYASAELTSAEDYVQLPLDQWHRPISIPNLSSVAVAPKKKFLWQIEYKSIPYFIRMFHQRLFVCDKYGTFRMFETRINGFFKGISPSISSI